MNRPEPDNKGDVFLGLRIHPCALKSYTEAEFGEFDSSYNGEWYAASPDGTHVAGNGSSWNEWPRPKFPETVTMNAGDCLKGWISMEVL